MDLAQAFEEMGSGKRAAGFEVFARSLVRQIPLANAPVGTSSRTTALAPLLAPAPTETDPRILGFCIDVDPAPDAGIATPRRADLSSGPSDRDLLQDRHIGSDGHTLADHDSIRMRQSHPRTDARGEWNPLSPHNLR